MIWNSGWRLAAAASNNGCLGLIGAGSMYPEILRENIQKCKAATDKPFGVNVPLLYPDIDKVMEIIVQEGVKIVFTSAGNPALWTGYLKEHGIIVVHVIANIKFAQKAMEAGADALVAEGFEAGGHNGKEETTTLCLVPLIRENIKLPLIAAGGIGSGKAMFACMALGADGVQIGSRFAISEESSSHPLFKQRVLETGDGGTQLMLKKLAPVRLIKNKFYEQVKAAEDNGAGTDELKQILGRARAKKGMFEGDLDEGELEIGQVAASFKKVQPVSEIVSEIVNEYNRLSIQKFQIF